MSFVSAIITNNHKVMHSFIFMLSSAVIIILLCSSTQRERPIMQILALKTDRVQR